MNSNYGKSNTKSGPGNHFDFDLGINSSRSRPLNEQKKPTNSYSSGSTFTTSYASKPGGTAANRPSWTHQPAAQSQPGRVGPLSGPSSMVGDIFGKTWNSSTPAASSVGIGVAKKDPNLFGDLVSSAFGQNQGNTNVPLKNLAPVGNKSSFSMGNVADSLPSKGSSTKSGGNWGSSGSFGSFTNGVSSHSGAGLTMNSGAPAYKSGNIGGGQSLKNMGGSVAGGGMGLNKDPFVSLVDLASKTSGSASSIGSNKSSGANDAFRDFQEAPKKNISQSSTSTFNDAFRDFQAAPKKNSSQFSTSTTGGASYSSVNDFVSPSSQPNSQPSVQSNGLNVFDDLFSSTVGEGSEGVSSQQFSGHDDWGMDSMGGGNDQGGTTELEGLSAPPAGISASSAKNKGMEYHKQGQYADAIKWLSWAVVLLEKAGEDTGVSDVLSCRASCYKEIGENKKAVADCSKVLEKDEANISVLVQRALLYESMEKYKLGAEDLRTVMKYDPGNRVARSTIHRLVKMAE